MRIEAANVGDHDLLSDITWRSKAYWGYTEEQMADWKDELILSTEYMKVNDVFKLFDGTLTLGYYSFLRPSKNEIITLDNLFVDPKYMGKGVGSLLLMDAKNKAISEKAKAIVLDADPNAADFYSKYQFYEIAKIPTTIKGRFLLKMRWDC